MQSRVAAHQRAGLSPTIGLPFSGRLLEVFELLMKIINLPRSCSAIVLGVLLGQAPPPVLAAHFSVGSKNCQECHKAEHEVWEKTKHFTSFASLHRDERVKDIIAAAGGDRNIRRNATCVQCHYTLEQADASATAAARSAVSCESCHGPASDWLKIHNDYGGPGATRESESAAHKAGRIAQSVAAGMTRPDSPYDLAANCLSCHSLAHSGLDGATIGKMLEAGHPINPDYELVKYSQGTVRHRFFPPDTTKNQEMTPAELSRWFVIGRAAMLVTASGALSKADHAGYKAALEKQIAAATAALNAVKSLPEAAALVAAPTKENARKLAATVAGKDLSGEVGSLLPQPADYK
jgi:hypothetical protein